MVFAAAPRVPNAVDGCDPNEIVDWVVLAPNKPLVAEDCGALKEKPEDAILEPRDPKFVPKMSVFTLATRSADIRLETLFSLIRYPE